MLTAYAGTLQSGVRLDATQPILPSKKMTADCQRKISTTMLYREGRLTVRACLEALNWHSGIADGSLGDHDHMRRFAAAAHPVVPQLVSGVSPAPKQLATSIVCLQFILSLM